MPNVNGIEIQDRYDVKNLLIALALSHKDTERLISEIKNFNTAVLKALEEIPGEIVALANKAIKIKVDQQLRRKSFILTSICSVILGLVLGLYLGGLPSYEFYQETLLKNLHEELMDTKEITNKAKKVKTAYEERLANFDQEKTNAINKAVATEIKHQQNQSKALDRKLSAFNGLAKPQIDSQNQILTIQLNQGTVYGEEVCGDLQHVCLIIRKGTYQ